MNGFSLRLFVVAVCGLIFAANSDASDPKVIFDIPSKVECTDVTPRKCAEVHPTLKVIEARFRISASFVEGKESSAADFVYMISSPDMRMRVLSFVPNTTLESSTAEDRIEVTDSSESSDSGTGEVKVSYSLLSLGAAKNSTSKKTESNHYQKVAPKNLVLASGTVNRGHGVFYKLRPSTGASLEGAKEFAVLCVVPKEWRGDWCNVVCSARASKKTTVSSTIAVAGIERAHVGLYMAGDREASKLSDELTHLQAAHGGLLSKNLTKEALQNLEELHLGSPTFKGPSTDWFLRVTKIKSNIRQTSIDSAKETLTQIEERFAELAASKSGDY
jgi:hypothetical protein